MVKALIQSILMVALAMLLGFQISGTAAVPRTDAACAPHVASCAVPVLPR